MSLLLNGQLKYKFNAQKHKMNNGKILLNKIKLCRILPFFSSSFDEVKEQIICCVFATHGRNCSNQV